MIIMKFTRFLTLSMGVVFLLASCNQRSVSNGNNNGGYNGGYTPSQTSTSVAAKSSKQSVIDWFKANGSYSDGSYTISSSTTVSGYPCYDFLYYEPGSDKFGAYTDLVTVSSSSGKVDNFSMVTFSWGSFTSGSFAGMTTYALSTGKQYQNTFRFTPTFSAYPTFEIKSYYEVEIQTSSSASNDASACALCLQRAINNLIKTLPSIGMTENLW